MTTPRRATPVRRAAVPARRATPRKTTAAAAKKPSAPRPSLRLTDEQVLVLDGFKAGNDQIITAVAGSGKSSTLREIAYANPTTPFLGIVYNKAAQEDAEAKSPKNMHWRTRHSLAYRAIGWRYSDRIRKGRIPSGTLARRLGITKSLEFGSGDDRTRLKPEKLASLVLTTVDRFCSSDCEIILPANFPRQPGLTPEENKHLARYIAKYANIFWHETIKPKSNLQFTDDYYFKLWLLSRPTLPYDVIMLDEAQDSTKAVRQLILSQNSAQKIAVGDPSQQLYQWLGAVNVMADWPGEEYALTMSFRFGEAVAEEANVWLDYTGNPLRVKGNPAVTSRVGSFPGDEVDAVLARSNGMCIQTAVEALEQGKTVGFSKDPTPLRRLAGAALQLKREGFTDHDELKGFDSWDEVVDHSETPEGADLKVFVKTVNRYGAGRLYAILKDVRDGSKEKCDLTVATIHSTKGLEWDRVRIADDFTAPDFENGEKLTPEQAMVGYVGVTRAKKFLDHTGSAWIHEMPSGGGALES